MKIAIVCYKSMCAAAPRHETQLTSESEVFFSGHIDQVDSARTPMLTLYTRYSKIRTLYSEGL